MCDYCDNMTEITCGDCGICFYVPDEWYREKSGNLRSFFCPNGCERDFVGKTTEEELQDERNSHRTTRGWLKRLRNKLTEQN